MSASFLEGYFLSSGYISNNKNINHRIARLAYAYTKSLAASQPYKIQFMALNEYFRKNKLKMTRHFRSYMLSRFRNTQKKDCALIKDFAFKNDFMTPRQSVIFSPKSYLYYTVQTFILMYKVKEVCTGEMSGHSVLDFSTNHVKIFYSGILDFKNTKIKKNSNYNYSYREFQKYRKKFAGNRVLKIDIQNFFGGIKVSKLEDVLIDITKPKHLEFPVEINNIINFLKASNYTTLPQSQGSLASAILSQVFLTNFTKQLENIASKRNLQIARYVDDMYIKLPHGMNNTEINEIINIISTELWKNGLSLNSKKTKIYSVKSYKNEVDFSNNVGGKGITSGSSFLVPTYIQRKIDDLFDNDGEKLLNFFSEVQLLYKRKGNDMRKYHSLVDHYFSVGNDNANKIQNALIFNGDWKTMLSLKSKEKLLTFPDIITFDPAKYVIFLLQVEKNVNLLTNNNAGKNTKSIIDYIQKIHSSSYDKYSVREGLIDSNYYIQEKNDIQALEYISTLSEEFYHYILKYVQHQVK